MTDTPDTPRRPNVLFIICDQLRADGHGARITGHHLQRALDRGGRYEDLVVPRTNESPAAERSERWWQVYKPVYGPELHSTTFVTERTIDFIEEAAAEDSPWLAWASFPDPHHPMAPPGECFDRHNAADMELPATIDDPLDHAPAYLQHVRHLGAADQRGWVGMFGATDHEPVRECLAATYGLIDMIDDGVGKILEAVDRLGQTDDTIVVFTSDHGDMMGDHGLMVKGFMHYRGTLQVPMVIADPTAEPGRTDSLAGSIDLPTTLLDRAGLPHYEGMQGHSLRPVLGDPATAVRDHVLIEEVRQRLIGEWICHPPEATECKFGKSKASKSALTCGPQRHASEAVLGLRPVTPR